MRRVTEYQFEIQKQCVNGPNSDIPITVKGQTCSGVADATSIAGVGTVPLPSPGLFMIALAVIVAGLVIAYEAGRRREFEG